MNVSNRRWVTSVVSALASLVLLGAALWLYFGRHEVLAASVCAALGAFAPAVLRVMLGRSDD